MPLDILWRLPTMEPIYYILTSFIEEIPSSQARMHNATIEGLYDNDGKSPWWLYSKMTYGYNHNNGYVNLYTYYT